VKSDLPIISPPSGPSAPPRTRSETEKYGAAYWLGLIGLAVLLTLVGWFVKDLFQLTPVWSSVYTLNDARASLDRRVEAAWELANDPRVTQDQLRELAFSRTPPEPARYLMAEAMSSEAVAADPRGFVLAVSRSEGWPPWLRLLLTRTIAQAAIDGIDVPSELVGELSRHSDRAVGLWADLALAFSQDSAAAGAARARLEAVAKGSGSPNESPLAVKLLQVIQSREHERADAFAQATRWMRENHSDARRVWTGWTFESTGRPVRPRS
jgi:hypothetical protein